jgi:3-oxoacyl-[acyl-carrier protein] reductase
MSQLSHPPPHPPGSLVGMRAVVTGASGGIGRQIAVALAAKGVSQIGVHYAANAAAARQTAAQLDQLGCQAVLLQADFASASECHQLVDEAFQRIANPTLWVHAAGADVLTGQAGQRTFQEKLRRLVEVDLIGSITVARRVAAKLAEIVANADDDGAPASLILIGWDQATEGMEGDAGQMFGPIKAGVEALGKSLAQEFAPQVRVNTIAPGWIRTAWGEGVSGYWDARARGQALMNRWGTGEDIGAAAAFLADPASSFITGQTLAVNGGFNRRWDHGR